MDRENDHSPGGPDQPNPILTDGIVVPVAPPRPAVPASYRGPSVVLTVSAPALDVQQSGVTGPEQDQALPLPLEPSPYSPGAPIDVEPKMPRPSVAATLPPPEIAVLQPTSPPLRVADPPSPQIADTRLRLAPEAHFSRGAGVSFGRDPSPTSATPARAGDFIPIASVAAAPLRIEPVFGPSTASSDTAASSPASERPSVQAPARSASRYIKTAAKFAVYAAAAYLALIACLIVAYRYVNPPLSSLMLQQWISGQAIDQSWANIDEISPQVVRAVLLSEDGRFCNHTGVDFDAMQDAIERAGDGAPRGASTISMQVVKNLFLWPSKSYVRKAIEIPLTWAMELVWPKSRIMEIYLNIAEWGPGIFGVEAAAQFHFQKSARRLNEREAAQLAVSLPNPYMRDAGDPGPKTRRLASDIQSRMRNAYPSQTSCVLRPGTAGR